MTPRPNPSLAARMLRGFRTTAALPNARRVRAGLAAVSAATVLSCTVPSAPPVGAADRGARSAAAQETPGWLAEAERSIAAREYEASDAGSGLQAPNRAHDLRTYFAGDGARVVGRQDGAELARLRTVGLGRVGELSLVPAGEVTASGARVEVRRSDFVEWFENSERGLEQGWTIAARPGGDGPLALEVSAGAEVARVDGDRAVLVSGGRRLQ
jgi:hypothetical protein